MNGEEIMREERFYQLKIRLLGIEPEIWRRFSVPASISLDRLHDVIQIVMGWNDSHLYEFTIGKKRYTEFPESRLDGLVCGRYRLGDLIKKEGRTFLYRYDFGDGWEHELTLEDSHFVEPVMLCFEGERACPPEDVGGVPGYYEFCRAVKDPAHEDHEELLEWVGGEYDGEYFDRTGINWMLLRYLRWSRDRHLDWGPIEWYEEE